MSIKECCWKIFGQFHRGKIVESSFSKSQEATAEIQHKRVNTHRVFVALRRFRRWKKFPPFDFFQFPFNFPQQLLFLSLKWIAARWKQPAEDSEKKRDPYRRRETDRQSIHLTYFWSSWEVIEFRLHVFARVLLLLCEASKEPMLLQRTVKTGTLQSSKEKICTITKRIEFRKRKWICKQMLRNIFFLHLNYTKRSQLQLRNAEEKRRNGVAHRNFIILFLIMEKISLSYLVRSIS